MLSLDTVVASEIKALADRLGAPLSEVAEVAFGQVLKIDPTKLAAVLESRKAQRQSARPLVKAERALVEAFKRLHAKGDTAAWKWHFKDVFGAAGMRPRDGWGPLRSLEARGLVREYRPVDVTPTDEQGRPTDALFSLVECIPLGHPASRGGMMRPDAPMAECDKQEHRDAYQAARAAKATPAVVASE